MRSLKFDTFVFEGMEAYRRNEYQLANDLLDKALLMNKDNYLAELWKIRSLVMLEKQEDALQVIEKYMQKKLDFRLKELLEKWKDICVRKKTEEIDVIELKKLNEETDLLQEKYQHQRNIRIIDLVFLDIVVRTIVLICGPRLLDLSTEAKILYGNMGVFIITVYYYYFKTILPANIYEIWIYILRTLRRIYALLVKEKSRYALLSGFVVLTAMNVLYGYNMMNEFFFTSVAAFMIGMLVLPIAEEIVFCGFMYGYVKNCKWLGVCSYLVGRSLFQGELIGYWYVILAMICLYAYHKKKTILAPIAIHFLSNISAGIAMYFK